MKLQSKCSPKNKKQQMQKRDTTPKDTLPEDVKQHCTEFTLTLSSIEDLLQPLIKNKEILNTKEMSPKDRAKLNLCCAYTVNTLFYMYLKTQGVDPNEHPVRDELKRVQEYMNKLRDQSAKFASLSSAQPQQQQEQPQESRPLVTVDRETAQKFLTRALNDNNKKQHQEEEAVPQEDKENMNKKEKKNKTKRDNASKDNDNNGESPKKRRRKNK